MCKVISVVNQKGGVGKTTTTVNVGIGLAREGKKVLLIDADPQGSLTASLGYEEPDDLRITLATIMMDVINEEEISLEDGILHHQENVDLLPANIELSALEVTMGNVMSREMIMKEYIDAIRSRYDYILIDCMPSLGMMTINALVSSDSVLIPVQAAYLPVKGLLRKISAVAVFLFVKSRFLGLSSFHPDKRISANFWLLHISEFPSHVLSGTFLCTLHLKIGNKLPYLHSTVRYNGSDR